MNHINCSTRMTRMTRPALALALTAALLMGNAQAGLMTLKNALKLKDFSDGYAAMTTSLTGGERIGVGRLGGVLTLNGVTDNSFLTYCTDLFQDVYFNTTYVDYSLVGTDTAHGFSAQQADLLGKLYTHSGAVHNTNDSVAFQLSVWEIVNETSHTLSVSNGLFKRTSGGSTTQIALANSWLSAISQDDADNAFDATRLFSPTAQDFVIFNHKPPPQRLPAHTAQSGSLVPEPGSAALTWLGLAAMAWLGRRRRTRK